MGERFGSYQLLKRLAVGGMGEVYLARAETGPLCGAKLVVKRVLPQLLEDTQVLELFLAEARIVAQLNHPNIPRVYELGEIEGVWYLTMEYVAGLDLRRLLAMASSRKIAVPLGVGCRIVSEIAAALSCAHQARDAQGELLQLVHRDVSPHNVLVGADGRVKLIDFGIARATSARESSGPSTPHGKYPYMSPEQVTNPREIDCRSDLFSLGAILWEVLVGRRLFEGASDVDIIRRVHACEPPAPSQVNPRVPAELEAICVKALKRDPAERYADAGQMQAALDEAARGLGLSSAAAEVEWFSRQFFSDPEDDLSGLHELGGIALPLDPDPAGLDTVAIDAPAPAASTEALDELTQVSVLDPPEQTPLLDASWSRRTNLTHPFDAFVGRADALAQISQLLAARGPDAPRLLVLQGTPGVGKTRLLFAAGLAHLGGQGPDTADATGGIWYVDLGGTADELQAASAVARVLGVPLNEGEPLARAARILRDRGPTLLLLDRVSSRLQGLLERWLAEAPQLQLLVAGEGPATFELGVTLALTGLVGQESGVRWDTSPAVKLFFVRALEVRPDLRVSEAEIPRVQQLCDRVRGTPLAIELLAWRMAFSSPLELAEALSARFGPERAIPLEDCLAWVWDQLQPWEQSALARLSIFRGGFTTDAAVAVLSAAPWAAARGAKAVLDVLRGRGLVRAVQPRGPGLRLSLHPHVRRFALDRLRRMNEEASTRVAHAQYFLAWASLPANDGDPISRLTRERDNLVEIFEDSANVAFHTPQTVAQGLRAVLALEPVLAEREPAALRQRWLDRALLPGKSAPPSTLDPALLARGFLARARARRDAQMAAEALADLEAAAALAEACDHPTLEASVHAETAALLHRRGLTHEAAERNERADALCVRADDASPVFEVTRNRAAFAASARDLDVAIAHARAAVSLSARLPNRQSQAEALGCLALLELERGLIDQGRVHLADAFTVHDSLRDLAGSMTLALSAATVYLADGRPSDARPHVERALPQARSMGDPRRLAHALLLRGQVDTLERRLFDAQEHLEACAELAPLVPADADELRRPRALAQAWLAVAHAAADHTDEAAIALRRAERALEGARGASLVDLTLELCAGHLELAQARGAADANDLARVESMQRAVADRLARLAPRCPRTGSFDAWQAQIAVRALTLARAEPVLRAPPASTEPAPETEPPKAPPEVVEMGVVTSLPPPVHVTFVG